MLKESAKSGNWLDSTTGFIYNNLFIGCYWVAERLLMRGRSSESVLFAFVNFDMFAKSIGLLWFHFFYFTLTFLLWTSSIMIGLYYRISPRILLCWPTITCCMLSTRICALIDYFYLDFRPFTSYSPYFSTFRLDKLTILSTDFDLLECLLSLPKLFSIRLDYSLTFILLEKALSKLQTLSIPVLTLFLLLI